MLSTVCHKYRLDPESKKHVRQQNAAEGTRHLVLGILPLLRSSIYLPVAVHVSHNGCRHSKTKPSTANKLYIYQQTEPSVAVNNHLLSLSTNIICRCQQTVKLPPVLKPIQLNKLSLQTRPEANKCFKGNYKPTMYFVLCIVCCVSQYCVVPTIKCKFFQQNLYIFHKNVKIYFV